jgi:hypothetical protein
LKTGEIEKRSMPPPLFIWAQGLGWGARPECGILAIFKEACYDFGNSAFAAKRHGKRDLCK